MMMMIKSEHTTTEKMRKKLPIQPVLRTRDGKRPGGDDVLGLSWSPSNNAVKRMSRAGSNKHAAAAAIR